MFHTDGTPCQGDTCAWKNTGGHATMTVALKDRAGQAADLKAALEGMADDNPDLSTVELQSSDQGYYGFTVAGFWENDGNRVGDYYRIENAQDNYGDLLSDLDWQGVVGEDKTGHATFDLNDYRTYITVQIPKDTARLILTALSLDTVNDTGTVPAERVKAVLALYRTLTQALGV